MKDAGIKIHLWDGKKERHCGLPEGNEEVKPSCKNAVV